MSFLLQVLNESAPNGATLSNDKVHYEKRGDVWYDKISGLKIHPKWYEQLEAAYEKNIKSKTETESETSDEDKDPVLDSYVKKIKNHPKRGKLATLIARGDAASLLAVDIMLSDKVQEAKDIIMNLREE